MRKPINLEQLKPFAMALIIIGVLALFFGVYRFVNAALLIQDNPAFKAQSNNQTVAPQSQEEAQILVSAGMQYRQLVGERNDALIIGGAGLILLALGWLGNDFIKSRQKSAAAATAPPVGMNGPAS